MTFRPDRFAGRPLSALLSAVARLKTDAISGGDLLPYHQAAAKAVMPCGQLPDDPTLIAVPGVMLEEYLGGGGQGCVFSARVTATGARIAVKVLSHGRAVREALLAARVRHPNVLRVLQAQRAGSYWVLLMELVQGTVLDRAAPADPRHCFARLADALTAVAAAGLVHRDVKPANVLIRADASPVLVDFGLAMDLGIKTDDDAEISGTPFFLPPEAWRDAKPEPSWDAYALGVTAALVLGASPKLNGNASTVRVAKLNGSFDLGLAAALEGIGDASLRQWVSELVMAEPHRRWTALATAPRWLAA